MEFAESSELSASNIADAKFFIQVAEACERFEKESFIVQQNRLTDNLQSQSNMKQSEKSKARVSLPEAGTFFFGG
jgi:hypothetical protein